MSCDGEELEVAGVAIEIDVDDVATAVASVAVPHVIAAIGREDVATVGSHADD